MIKKELLLLLLLFTLTACRVNTTAPVTEITNDSPYWPTNGWRTASPEDFGMDGELLNEAASYIEENDVDLHSLVVIKDGYIVAENYFNEYDQETPHKQYSVTKSFVSATIGIAYEEGYIGNLDQTLEDFFPDYTFQDETAKKITLENILTMRTGLGWIEGDPGYYGLVNANDAVEYMLKLPMTAEPGEKFAYCSGCSFLLSAIITEKTGMDTAEYAQKKLFDPLGIKNPQWETVSNGISNGGWGLYLTPREMAKFGYLYLNQGEWNGEQVISSEWVQASSEPGLKADQYADYGYQWWISPEGYYSAQGLFGQAIFVIPEHNMVVVMTADLRSENIEFRLLHEYILAAVQ